MKARKKVKKTTIKSVKEDFVLSEKELDKVAGGAAPDCTEVGVANPSCTKAGMGSRCGEIGLINPNCTKTGS